MGVYQFARKHRCRQTTLKGCTLMLLFIDNCYSRP
nr:MAG TPA: hypothetical protein [Caudoviricetes sp.]